MPDLSVRMPPTEVSHASSPLHASPADLAACRNLLRGGSRTFYAASFMLPRRVREAATALYAFCRLADDAVDLDIGGAAPAIYRLRERLARAYAGRPLPIAADRALADVVARYAVPREIPEALIDGFAWDVEGRRYEDLPHLCAYAVRVAGAVGIAMALLMERRGAAALARACDLGVAMQLTNIARDVGEDARAGRLYLPLTWLREEGVDPERWLARPVFEPAIGRVVQRLLAAADDFYGRACAGIAALPIACRPGIRAACLVYAAIGTEVSRNGFDSISQRARVRAARKAELLVRALAPLRLETAPSAAPVLPEARFLLDAVEPAGSRASIVRPASGIGDRLVWVIDLFERLERAQRSTS